MVMRIVDEAERIALLIVAGVPAVVIVLHAVLALLDANPVNPLVEAVATGADRVTYDPLETVLQDQHVLQTAALALAPWGVVAGAVAVVFRFIRAVVERIDHDRALRR